MLSLGVEQAKDLFFDRERVMAAVARGKRAALSKGAALVRLIAKRSIRKRKGPSKPGNPPHSHKGQLRNLLFYAYDPNTESAVAGPARLTRSTEAPATLEFGGSVPSGFRDRRRVRKVGDGGEIRVSGGRFSGPGRGKGGRFTSRGQTTKRVDASGGSVFVTYTRLDTAAQAARATAINADLYRPGRVRIEPRPYMGPALRIASPALPSHWKNSVRS